VLAVSGDVLRGRLLLWGTALAAVLAVGLPAFRPVLGNRASVLVGPAIGAALYIGLAGAPPRLRLPTVPHAMWLAGSAAFEELVWRAVVLAALAAWIGAVAALLLTSVAFAVAHQARLGRRAGIHVITGAGFGAAFLCAGLAASFAAHWIYNLLVDLSLRSERECG